MALDYTTYCTAEGDRIILELQSARFLIKCMADARKGELVEGLAAYTMDAFKPGFDISKHLSCNARTVEDMKNLGLLRELFKYRTLSHLIETEARLKGLLDSGASYDSAWNACAVDLVTCSRAHCYYIILENFVSSVEATEDANVRKILTVLCQAYALFNLTEDLGSFELTAAQKRMAKEALRQLFPIIRNDCVALVDAFEFPVSYSV